MEKSPDSQGKRPLEDSDPSPGAPAAKRSREEATPPQDAVNMMSRMAEGDANDTSSVHSQEPVGSAPAQPVTADVLQLQQQQFLQSLGPQLLNTLVAINIGNGQTVLAPAQYSMAALFHGQLATQLPLVQDPSSDGQAQQQMPFTMEAASLPTPELPGTVTDNVSLGRHCLFPSKSSKAVSTHASGSFTSMYRGVTKHRLTGRFEAHFWDSTYVRPTVGKKGRSKGKQIYLGGFADEKEAARAYDKVALVYSGPKTPTNFPASEYADFLARVTSPEAALAEVRRTSAGFARGKSRYRGVSRHASTDKWEARIKAHGGSTTLYLGVFDSAEDAARAYDREAVKLRGEKAVTNFDVQNYADIINFPDACQLRAAVTSGRIPGQSGGLQNATLDLCRPAGVVLPVLGTPGGSIVQSVQFHTGQTLQSQQALHAGNDNKGQKQQAHVPARQHMEQQQRLQQRQLKPHKQQMQQPSMSFSEMEKDAVAWDEEEAAAVLATVRNVVVPRGGTERHGKTVKHSSGSDKRGADKEANTRPARQPTSDPQSPDIVRLSRPSAAQEGGRYAALAASLLNPLSGKV